MLRTNSKDKILEFYDTFITHTKYLNDPQVVAWSSRKGQYERFKVLLDIGVNKTDTVLDLGCGMGHLTDYLLLHTDYLHENYTGIDINTKYVEACRMRKPDHRFLCGEIFDLSEKFDYVVGSGIFTVEMAKTEILDAIAYAYKSCKKGVAFNFLNKEYMVHEGVNSFAPEEFYAEIAEVYPNSKLLSDYLGTEDFTIYINK